MLGLEVWIWSSRHAMWFASPFTMGHYTTVNSFCTILFIPVFYFIELSSKPSLLYVRMTIYLTSNSWWYGNQCALEACALFNKTSFIFFNRWYRCATTGPHIYICVGHVYHIPPRLRILMYMVVFDITERLIACRWIQSFTAECFTASATSRPSMYHAYVWYKWRALFPKRDKRHST